jgi:hypothetical protein
MLLAYEDYRLPGVDGACEESTKVSDEYPASVVSVK